MMGDDKGREGRVHALRAGRKRPKGLPAAAEAQEKPDRHQQGDPTLLDPRGLIRESYRISGVSMAECRSIFLDWLLGVPVDVDARSKIRPLLGYHERDFPDHPMTRILRQGLEQPIPHPRRRKRRRSARPVAGGQGGRDATA